MKTFRRTICGMTLVELMVSSGLLVAVGLSSLQFLTEQNKFFQTSVNHADIDDHMHIILNQMSKEIQQAKREMPLGASSLHVIDPQTVEFFLPTDQDADGTIVDSIGELEWDLTNPISYSYDSDNKQILRTDNTGTSVIARDVDAVQFDDSSTDNSLYVQEFKVSLTVKRITNLGREVQAAESRIVFMRN